MHQRPTSAPVRNYDNLTSTSAAAGSAAANLSSNAKNLHSLPRHTTGNYSANKSSLLRPSTSVPRHSNNTSSFTRTTMSATTAATSSSTLLPGSSSRFSSVATSGFVSYSRGGSAKLDYAQRFNETALVTSVNNHNKSMLNPYANTTSAATGGGFTSSSRPASAATSTATTTHAAAATRPTSASLKLALEMKPDFQRRALRALEDVVVGNATLRDIREELTVEAEAEDAVSCATPEAKLDTFMRLMVEDSLAQFPQLQSFVRCITSQYDKYIGHMKRQTSTTAASLLRETLTSVTSDLNKTRKELDDANGTVADLRQVVQALTKANHDSDTKEKDLRSYVDELRCVVASQSNKALASDAPLAPDQPSAANYLEAIRAMSSEIEHLRRENIRLSQGGLDQCDTIDKQNRELEELVERANDFQHQIGQMKGTILVMRNYVNELEARMLEHSATYSKYASQVHATTNAEATLAAESVALHDCVGCGLRSCLKLKAPAAILEGGEQQQQRQTTSFASPDAYDTIDEYLFKKGAMAALGTDSSAVPLHLQTTLCDLAPTRMTTEELCKNINGLLGSYAAANSGKRDGEKLNFSEFLKDEFRNKYVMEKGAMEKAYTFHYMASFFKRTSFDALLYHLASAGHVAPEAQHVVPLLLKQLQEKLRLEAVTASKKAKDKIARAEFLRIVRSFLFPFVTTSEIEMLAVVTFVAAEGKAATEDISYDPFFDPTSPQAIAVNDLLKRLIMSCGVRTMSEVRAKLTTLLREVFAKEFERVNSENKTFEGQRMMNFKSIEDNTIGKITLDQFRDVLSEVDPHCGEDEKIRRLAVAARNYKITSHGWDGEEMYDAHALVANLQQQVFFVPAQPPTASMPSSD